MMGGAGWWGWRGGCGGGIVGRAGVGGVSAPPPTQRPGRIPHAHPAGFIPGARPGAPCSSNDLKQSIQFRLEVRRGVLVSTSTGNEAVPTWCRRGACLAGVDGSRWTSISPWPILGAGAPAPARGTALVTRVLRDMPMCEVVAEYEPPPPPICLSLGLGLGSFRPSSR
jgi:hypothetical protein